MRPATSPAERRSDGKLLVVDAAGGMRHARRSHLVDHLESGDLLVANDAATIPASLRGVHVPTGEPVEVRLAGRHTLDPQAVLEFTAVLFGDGDHRVPTEDRPPPPPARAGDHIRLGPLRSTVLGLLDHPRLVLLRFDGTVDEVWTGIARHGKPIQYAHVPQPLALSDVWTRIAVSPVAFEAPSAGFVLDWRMLRALARKRIGFATLRHAAGISSTGDPSLDARLPLDEAYDIPTRTVEAITHTKAVGRRVIAVGTTVIRALEDSASTGCGLQPGPGVATQLIGKDSPLRVVDAVVTGVHEPGESHYELLRAFAGAAVLAGISSALHAGGYRTHEFGDSLLLARQQAPVIPRGGRRGRVHWVRPVTAVRRRKVATAVPLDGAPAHPVAR